MNYEPITQIPFEDGEKLLANTTEWEYINEDACGNSVHWNNVTGEIFLFNMKSPHYQIRRKIVKK